MAPSRTSSTPPSAIENDSLPRILVREPTGFDEKSAGSQGVARPTEASESVTDAEGLPIIEDFNCPLDYLLRFYEIRHPEAEIGGYWTLKLLRHILSRDRIRRQLGQDYGQEKPKDEKLTLDRLLDAIYPEQEPYPGSSIDKDHYLRIYALLLLCGKSKEIDRFVQKGYSDKIFPIKLISLPDGNYSVVHRVPGPDVSQLECFNGWENFTKDWVQTEQRRLLTPYFDLDEQGKAKHSEFPKGTILPWWQSDDREVRSTAPSTREGGFAFVSKVWIHPTSHGFGKVLKTIQLKNKLFALKKLSATTSDKKAFESELENLNRFSGLVHDHLVTLLATFTLDYKFYFLFPCAECALDEYWEEREPDVSFDIDIMRWASKQIAGITAAVDTIHEPKHLHSNLKTPGERRYGRHGDIKPDNILWFRSAKDRRGVLVVSDMGLTSFNRDISRSNIPGRKIGGAPGYRPPECEVKGGKVSRAFDIWTLGCLFLELTTWLLGGWELVEKFQTLRLTVFVDGINRDVFFDIKEFEMEDGSMGNVAQVKEEVTKWFVQLHKLPRCTQFVHDVLDVIEHQMLIVLSEQKKRSLSGPLRERFDKLYRRCMDDSDRDYAMKPAPETREFEKAVGVEVELDTVTEETIEQAEKRGQKKLSTYVGPRQQSIRPDDLARMDELGDAIGQVQLGDGIREK